MFAQERRQLISNLIQEKGTVLVKELSAQFGVTEDCIRKDLALLEQGGVLRRTYGGAVSARKNPHLFDVEKRLDRDVVQKRAIAVKAAELVEDGDMIFLDISTSSLELAKLLFQQGRRVTVVSNMVAVIHEASQVPGVQFIAVGGLLNRGGDGFTGSLSCQLLTKFKFDKAFLGVVGIDGRSGAVYTYEAPDGDTKAAALSVSRRRYLLCETMKFRQDGNYQYGTLREFDGAILDQPPAQDLVGLAKKQGIELL